MLLYIQYVKISSTQNIIEQSSMPLFIETNQLNRAVFVYGKSILLKYPQQTHGTVRLVSNQLLVLFFAMHTYTNTAPVIIIYKYISVYLYKERQAQLSQLFSKELNISSKTREKKNFLFR